MSFLISTKIIFLFFQRYVLKKGEMQINPMPHKSLSIFNQNEIYIEYTKRCSPLILLDQKPLRPNFNGSGVPIPLNDSFIFNPP